jgi:hypothetical protein
VLKQDGCSNGNPSDGTSNRTLHRSTICASTTVSNRERVRQAFREDHSEYKNKSNEETYRAAQAVSGSGILMGVTKAPTVDPEAS